MDQNKPQISFTFPLRWLNDPEDRKYLKDNLVKLARNSNLQVIMHDKLSRGFISAYQVLLKTHAYQPVPIKLTQNQINTILSELFGGARCVNFESLFVQMPASTSLPMLEMEVFF
jgi:hypothetical protein